VLLDGEGEEVDLLKRLDLAVLDKAAEFGDRDPVLLLLAPTAATASPATTATSTAVSAPTSAPESSSEPPRSAGAASAMIVYFLLKCNFKR